MAITIGIDLGQAFSSVAAYRSDRVEIIPDAQGRERIPTVDLLGDQDAGAKQALNISTKGPRTADISPPFVVNQQCMTTILRRLKSLAESYINEPVEHVVITVPASYGDIQRQLTRDAGRKAGLIVLRLLNAPTAAGIAHWVDRPKHDDYFMFVLDVGASRADATLLKISDGMFEIKSSVGDARLGGRDYDSRLLDHFASKKQGRGQDFLIEACEHLKLSLSESDCSEFDCDLSVTRIEFENICEEIFRSTMALISRALDDARVGMSIVQEVVLVGGSARIPKLQKVVADFFGRPSEEIRYPDMACVRGAALQAACLSDPFFHELLVLDIAPNAMHLELHAGSLIQLWPRNTVLAHQSAICMAVESCKYLPRYLKLFEGSFETKKCVGTFDITPLYVLSLTGRGLEIEVTAAVDLDGVLDASLVSRNPVTAREITVKLEKCSLQGHGDNQLQIDKEQSEGSLDSYISFLRSISRSLTAQQCENLQTAITQVHSDLSDGQERNEDEDRLVLEQLIQIYALEQLIWA